MKETDAKDERAILAQALTAARWLLTRCRCQAPGGEDPEDFQAWIQINAGMRVIKEDGA